MEAVGTCGARVAALSLVCTDVPRPGPRLAVAVGREREAAIHTQITALILPRRVATAQVQIARRTDKAGRDAVPGIRPRRIRGEARRIAIRAGSPVAIPSVRAVGSPVVLRDRQRRRVIARIEPDIPAIGIAVVERDVARCAAGRDKARMRARPGGNGPDGDAVRAGNLVRCPGDREPEGRAITRMSGIDTLHFNATAVEPHVAVTGIGTWVIGRLDGPSERARADRRDNRVEARHPEMAPDAIDVSEPDA